MNTDLSHIDESQRDFGKFNKDIWGEVENSKPTEIEKKVIAQLCSLGDPKTDLSQYYKQPYIIGETFYREKRKELYELKLVKGQYSPIKIKKHCSNNKKRKGLSETEIRNNNSRNRVDKIITDLLSTFSKTKLNYEFGLSSDYIELRGITFMYCAWFILENQLEKYKKESKLVEVFDLIVGIRKFIHSASTYKGKSIVHPTGELICVSPSMINDLQRWYDELEEIFDFSGLRLYEKAPRLIIYSNYDYTLPSASIIPRQHQKDIINLIKNNNHYVYFYKAMIGSGKTSTAALSIPSYVQHLRNEYKSQGKKLKLEVLFCCNIDTVRLQAATLAYLGSLKFGVAYMDHDTPRISNQYMCKKDEDRVIIITDPITTLHLLQKDNIRRQKEKNDSQYILFLDEPTVGADIQNSPELYVNTKIMYELPDKTILSSATLPEPESLRTFTQHHLRKYPNCKINVVRSNDVQIGCELKTYDGEIIMPHSGCKTVNELKNVLTKIEQNPFLGSLFTPKVTTFLKNKMEKLGVTGLPNLNEIFSDILNLSVDKVREVSVKLLNILINKNDDSLIKQICSVQLDNSMKDKKLPETLGFNFSKLGTTDAYKFLCGTLIITDNPINFCLKNFAELLEDLKKNGYSSSTKIIAKYNRAMIGFNKEYQRFDKRIKDDEKKSQLQQATSENASPKLDFPDWGQINTAAHIQRYANDKIKIIDKYGLTCEFPIESLPLDSQVQDQLMMLLFSLVGIYAQYDNNLDNPYRRAVLNKVSQRQLGYLVADNTISFGTNYPFNKVILDSDVASKHSIGTIFQQLRRAGRVGKSWIAEGYIDNATAKRLLDYIHDPNETSCHEEAINMEKMFLSVQKEKEFNSKINISPQHKFNEDTSDKIIDKKVKIEFTPMKQLHTETTTYYKKKYIPPHLRTHTNNDPKITIKSSTS